MKSLISGVSVLNFHTSGPKSSLNVPIGKNPQSLSQNILTWALLTLRPHDSLFWVAFLMQCGMVSRISSFYPLDAINTAHTTAHSQLWQPKNVSKYCQASPGREWTGRGAGGKILAFEDHCFRLFITIPPRRQLLPPSKSSSASSHNYFSVFQGTLLSLSWHLRNSLSI